MTKKDIEATEESQGMPNLRAIGAVNNELQHAQHTQGRDYSDLMGHPANCRTRYVLDIGQAEDWLALQVSMAPCLIGYGEIAKRLHADPKTKREGNIYWKWIENYVADDYSEAVQIGSGEFPYYIRQPGD